MNKLFIKLTILIFLLTSLPVSNSPFNINSQAQNQGSNNTACLNGLNKFTHPDLRLFSFCYDSSTTVKSNIRSASQEEKEFHYQTTKSNYLSKIGNISVTKGNSTLIFNYIEGNINHSPELYCTANGVNISSTELGSITTPRRAIVDIQPTLNQQLKNEYSEPFNNNKGLDNNILYPKDPTAKKIGELPTLYDINVNSYIDTINGFNSKMGYKESSFPFVIVPQGFQLPFTTEKDKRIIENKKYNSFAYDISNYSQRSFEPGQAKPENQQWDKSITDRFLNGEGTCYDNSQRLFGLRLDSELIINNQHSSSADSSPDKDNNYQEVVYPNTDKSEYTINSGRISLPPNLLNTNIPSIKIYSNTNQLSTLTDTLESICWNKLSCQRRDQIMSRTPVNTNNIYPANPLTKDASGFSTGNTKEDQDKLKQQEEEDKLRRDNPFYGKKVVLKYIIHCDDKAELLESDIPEPVLESILEDPANNKEVSNYNLTLKVIAKGFPIELRTEERTNCEFWNLKFNKENHVYELNNNGIGVQNINNFVYKDTINFKDEDVASFWTDNMNTSNDSISNSYYTKTIKLRNLERMKVPLVGFEIGDTVSREKEQLTNSDLIYARSRIYGEINLNFLNTRKGKEIKFEYNDQQKFSSLNPISEYGLTKYKNESEKSNIFKLGNIASTTGLGIEEPFYVTGGEEGGGLKTEQVDISRRKIKLTMSDIDKQKNQDWDLKSKLPDTTNIWLISHGWDDYDSKNFREIANIVKTKYPEDLVLTVNWSEASNNAGKTNGGNCRACSWVDSVANGIKSKIKNQYGIENGNKIRLIGHSLGSILSATISTKFTNRADYLFGLDTPREFPCKGIDYDKLQNLSLTNLIDLGDKDAFGNKYWYNISKTQPRYVFRDSAKIVRTFVGLHSFAGSRDAGREGNKAFHIDFDTKIINMDFGNEHVWVVETFKQLIKEDKFEDNFLSLEDKSQHDDLLRKSGGVPFGVLNRQDEKSWSEYGWDNYNGVIQLNRQIRGSDKETVHKGDVRRVWIKTEDNESYKKATFSKDN